MQQLRPQRSTRPLAQASPAPRRDVLEQLCWAGAYVLCAESAKPRHVYSSILSQLAGSKRKRSSGFAPEHACDSCNDFLLKLPAHCPLAGPAKFVVLDQAQRLGKASMLGTILRARELAHANISVVLVSSYGWGSGAFQSEPRPGACVAFPAYSQEQMLQILAQGQPPCEPDEQLYRCAGAPREAAPPCSSRGAAPAPAARPALRRASGLRPLLPSSGRRTATARALPPGRRAELPAAPAAARRRFLESVVVQQFWQVTRRLADLQALARALYPTYARPLQQGLVARPVDGPGAAVLYSKMAPQVAQLLQRFEPGAATLARPARLAGGWTPAQRPAHAAAAAAAPTPPPPLPLSGHGHGRSACRAASCCCCGWLAPGHSLAL
jgi:hypothetical protein